MTNPLITGNIRQSWTAVAVDEVIVRERQRRVKAEHVQNVRASFASLGGQLQLQPIVLDKNLVLIDGAHRLSAAKESGWTHISALILDGVDEEDRALLEAEANRVRLQLTPLELEEAWSTIYEPAFKARAKQNQAKGLDNLRQGKDLPVTGTSGNREAAPASMPRAAKEATGLSIETLNKITDIRAVASSSTASEELRTAAEKGLSKLQRPGASVETVHKALIKLQERTSRLRQDPVEVHRKALEKRLDQTLTETTLLQERLGGDLGAELLAAARLEHIAAEQLRAVRIALTTALSRVVAIECGLSGDPAANLNRIGGEVTRMLSEETIKSMELEPDHGQH